MNESKEQRILNEIAALEAMADVPWGLISGLKTKLRDMLEGPPTRARGEVTKPPLSKTVKKRRARNKAARKARKAGRRR